VEPVTRDAAAAAEVSRLDEIRAIRKQRDFDPVAYVVDEIQRKPGKAALKISDRVRAAETLAKLELDYERLELAKKGGTRGMRVQSDGNGGITVDMFDDLGVLTDDQLESRIKSSLETLGIAGG
jgi:hypothetical protein